MGDSKPVHYGQAILEIQIDPNTPMKSSVIILRCVWWLDVQHCWATHDGDKNEVIYYGKTQMLVSKCSYRRWI